MENVFVRAKQGIGNGYERIIFSSSAGSNPQPRAFEQPVIPGDVNPRIPTFAGFIAASLLLCVSPEMRTRRGLVSLPFCHIQIL
jgi:hypothetical protein